MTVRVPKNLGWFALFEKFLGSGLLKVITIERKEILRVTLTSTVKFGPAAIQKIRKVVKPGTFVQSVLGKE